jgi:hypothetical protein
MLHLFNGIANTNVVTSNASEGGTLVYDKQNTHHFFFGDETALGVFYHFKEMALRNNHEYFGVLELEPENEPLLQALKLLVDCVPPTPGMPADNAVCWMEDMHPNCWKAWKKASFYLAGNELSVQHFREYLLQKEIEERQIQMQTITKTATY